MKTKINLIEKLYDDEQKPIKEHSETAQSVLQKIAEKDIKQYSSTNKLLKEVTDEFSKEELTVQEILKTISLGDVGDKEEKGDSDFDLYMDLRTTTSEVILNDEQIDRLKHKLKKLNVSTLVRGQVKYILSGKPNPLKPNP